MGRRGTTGDAGVNDATNPVERPSFGQRIVAFATARFAAAIAIAVALSALLRWLPTKFLRGNGGDATRYLAWSTALANAPVFWTHYPKLIDDYNHRWVGFSTPLRWAWLGTLAMFIRILPATDDPYFRQMLVSYLGGTLMFIPLALWLRRIAPMSVALLALLLCATAPLLRGAARIPLPDAYHLFFLLTAAACASGLRESRGRNQALRIVGIFFASLLTIGTRETGVIALVVVAFLPTIEHGWNLRADLPLVGALVVAGLSALGVWVICAGSVRALIAHLGAVFWGNAHTGNGFEVAGPYYRYLVDFTIIDPWIVMLTFAAIVPLASSSTLRPVLRVFGGTTLLMFALFCFLPKSLRYVLFIDVGMRVLCAAALVRLFAERTLQRYALLLLVILLAHDEVLYWATFGPQYAYDPTTHGLVRPLNMGP